MVAPEARWQALLPVLRPWPLAVAFSGGLDSRFLCFALRRAGCDVLALHATGPHVPQAESAAARRWARAQGLPLREVRHDPLSLPDVAVNSRERCYACKRALMRRLREALAAAGGPANVVNETARALMGPIGGVLAILGVVALPVTSGDTAFRAARLTIAEMFNFKQSAIPARLAIAIPIFAIGVVLNFVDFNVIWRYFGFANQALAAIMLWAAAAYLYRKHRLHWICTVPATFMTAVCTSYICYEPKMGFGMGIQTADIIGVIAAAICLVAFLALARKPIAGAPSIDEV